MFKHFAGLLSVTSYSGCKCYYATIQLTPLFMKSWQVIILTLSILNPYIYGGEDTDENGSKLSGLKFSVGYVSRSFDDLRFSTGSYSQEFSTTELTGEPFSRASSAGAMAGSIDRNYDDGFVKVDATDSFGEVTWNWAYENSLQVDGNSIVFTDSSGRDVTHDYSDSFDPYQWSDDLKGGGPSLQVSYNVNDWRSFKIAASLELSFFDVHRTNNSSTFRAQRISNTTQTIVKDTFGLGGTVPPEPPHEGTFENPGPLINSVPSDRTVTVQDFSSETFNFANHIKESLDFSLVTLSPGISASITREKYQFGFGLGISLNIIDWEARFRESLDALSDEEKGRKINSWESVSSGNDVLFGAFLHASTGMQISESFSFSVFVRRDWASDLRAEVGPSDLNLKLSGTSGGVRATYSF